jgi:hypothetical protein
MTIGTKLLTEAKEKLKAALEAVRDELRNPDTHEEVRTEFAKFGHEMNDHFDSLGLNLESDEGLTLVTQEQSGETRELQVKEPLGEKIEEAVGTVVGEAKFGQ